MRETYFTRKLPSSLQHVAGTVYHTEGLSKCGGGSAVLQGEIAFTCTAPTEQNNVPHDKKLLHKSHIVCLASL